MHELKFMDLRLALLAHLRCVHVHPIIMYGLFSSQVSQRPSPKGTPPGQGSSIMPTAGDDEEEGEDEEEEEDDDASQHGSMRGSQPSSMGSQGGSVRSSAKSTQVQQAEAGAGGGSKSRIGQVGGVFGGGGRPSPASTKR